MDAMPQFSKSQLIFPIFWGKCRECIGRILCLHTARKRENSPSLLLPDTISGFVTALHTHTHPISKLQKRARRMLYSFQARGDRNYGISCVASRTVIDPGCNLILGVQKIIGIFIAGNGVCGVLV
jgi:hypothetical protein